MVAFVVAAEEVLMARIRTIKPSFFRHDGLQELEAAYPGKHPMLVFCGLWTQADKAGRFEWRPRQLKLDILPFLDFDMEGTLAILEGAGFVFKYAVNGKYYGVIPTFAEHQRFSGKEAQGEPLYPAPPEGPEIDQRGSIGEAPGKHPGSTREPRNRNKERNKERNGSIAWSDEARAFIGIQAEHQEKWSKAYPAIDLKREIARAEAWVDANPKNKKSNWPRFLNAWMKRAQDRAPARGGEPSRWTK